MHIILLILLFIGLIFGPQWWARYTFKRYAKKQDHIPGTGAELARHLLDRFDIKEVQVEITKQGDHYDPDAKRVRLTESNYNDNSLTAVAVAAHEVGHAIQHHNNEAKLILRTRLVKVAEKSAKLGSIIMVVMPLVMIITRSPVAGVLLTVAGLASIAGSAVIHLVTLPVEWDASFGKALPILKQDYIQKEDHAAVERILKAAAFTYVAASLASIFNIWRWIVLLRR
jgi:Zn-dependent membrane protease YugP